MGLDIGIEDAPVHRPVDDEGSGERVGAQSGDEGLRLPVSERGLGLETLALEVTPALARHLGIGSRLIQEDKPVRFEPHRGLAFVHPFAALLGHVGPILL